MAQQVESAPAAAEEVIADDSAVSGSPAGSAPTDAPAAKAAVPQKDATADADASAAQIDEDPNASSAPVAPSAAAEEPAAAAEPTDNGPAAAAPAEPAAADDAPVAAGDAPAADNTEQELVEDKQEESKAEPQEEQKQQQEAKDAKSEAEEPKEGEQEQQPSASASEQPLAAAAAGAAAVEEASKAAEAPAAPAAEAAAVVEAKGNGGDASPFVPADAKLQTPPKEAQANGGAAHASDAASPAASASTPAAEELSSRLSANAPSKRLSTSGSGGPAIVPPGLARSVSSSGLRSGEASPASTSAHDSKNTINVSLLLKAGAFKKVPLKDFVPYEELQRLRVEDGIDATRKEDYLSEEEFAKVFGMPRDTFKAQPAWRQAQAKKKTNLF